MSKRKKIFLVSLLLILAFLFLVLCVLFACQVNYRYFLEVNTQISQFGFYKNDIILLVDNHAKLSLDTFGLVSCTLGTCYCFFCFLFDVFNLKG